MAHALAKCGAASRRKAEELVRAGLVTVNGHPETNPATIVNPAEDVIAVEGNTVKIERNIYILLNKPPGFISSVSDPQGRPTVLDLIKDIEERVFPVGRLDYDTAGLLLLSNDGEFTNLMTHPRYEIKKTYHALVQGVPTARDILRLERGLPVDGRISAPARARLLSARRGCGLVEIELHEGRKRQVRKMMAALGYPVVKLTRVKFAFLELRGLAEGQYRYLKSQEVQRLKQEARRARLPGKQDHGPGVHGTGRPKTK